MTTLEVDPIYEHPTEQPCRRRQRSYPVEIVTKNEPREVPALLVAIDDANQTEEALLWRKMSKVRTLREDELLPKSHPARFHLYRSEKGVEEAIESKEPAMPVALIHKKHHLIYQWRIHDDRGVHNHLLEGVNEYTLQSPNGRLAFYDPITESDGVMVIIVTLVGRTIEMREVEDFRTEITYGGRIPSTDAFVYVTFRRFYDEEEEEEKEETPSSLSMRETKETKKEEEEEEETEESEPSEGEGVSGNEEKENEQEEENEEKFHEELSGVLKPRTLATVSVVVPLRI